MKKLLILLPAITLFAACQQPAPAGQMTDKNTQVSVKVTDEKMDHSMDVRSMIKSDQDFLEMMISHHQEAVDSSKVLIAKTQNEELKKFLQGVIDAQTKEIEQMKTWYKDWFKKDYAPASGYMAMMPDLTKMEGAVADQAYIKSMIAHHQGAIDAAKQLSKVSKRYELIQFATAVIEVQTKENELLATWLK